jgi:hypothetical protein
MKVFAYSYRPDEAKYLKCIAAATASNWLFPKKALPWTMQVWPRV